MGSKAVHVAIDTNLLMALRATDLLMASTPSCDHTAQCHTILDCNAIIALHNAQNHSRGFYDDLVSYTV